MILLFAKEGGNMVGECMSVDVGKIDINRDPLILHARFEDMEGRNAEPRQPNESHKHGCRAGNACSRACCDVIRLFVECRSCRWMGD